MALRRTLTSRFLHSSNFTTQHPLTAPMLPKRDLPHLPNLVSSHRRLSHPPSIPICNDLIKTIRSSLSRNPDLLLPPRSKIEMKQDSGIETNKMICSSFSPDPDPISPPRSGIEIEQDSGIETVKMILSSLSRYQDPISPPKSGIEMKQDSGIETNPKIKISVKDVRKLLQYSRIEKAREKLRAISKPFISYSDFDLICSEIAGGGDYVAAALYSSGDVIIIGGVVFLRPQHLAKEIESVIDAKCISDLRRSELKEMEAEKAIIDGKAEAQVRRELWAGLGFAVFQTAAFMRLTFWELSWDVMEPVCFFTASIYFIMGWAFFLRTSKEPCFEGFFAGRFVAKQRRLMKARSFDLCRFNELRTAFL